VGLPGEDKGMENKVLLSDIRGQLVVAIEEGTHLGYGLPVVTGTKTTLSRACASLIRMGTV
jgi:hypothetical protein